MLKFREINYDQDLPEIIELLNRNFDTIHTIVDFKWKHLENPFGISYGLLAIDEEKIVGLRMFMRWEFKYDSKIIKAIRPVDTCTDHSQRGKGLFKKITLQGLQNIKSEYDLIFNTPNSNSKPGYLKMGWKVFENELSYRLGIYGIMGKTLNFNLINATQINLPQHYCSNNYTVVSNKILQWRYDNSEYKIAQFEDNSLLIYKVSRIKGFKAVIIYDSFKNGGALKPYVNSLCNYEKTKLFYYLNNEKNNTLNPLVSFKGNDQTVVKKDDLYNVSEHLQFSLGDLEGRL